MIYRTWCRVLGSTSPHTNPARVQPSRGLIRGPSGAEIFSIHKQKRRRTTATSTSACSWSFVHCFVFLGYGVGRDWKWKTQPPGRERNNKKYLYSIITMSELWWQTDEMVIKPVSQGTLDLLTSPYSSSTLCFASFFYFLLTKALYILQNLGTIFIY